MKKPSGLFRFNCLTTGITYSKVYQQYSYQLTLHKYLKKWKFIHLSMAQIANKRTG